MGHLRQYLPASTYSIASAYREGKLEVQVGGTTIHADDSLGLFFPKPHQFQHGDLVTIHLDNRTGVEELDIELRVYRASYKGWVSSASADRIEVQPVQYQLFHGTRIVAEMALPGYEFPPDNRATIALPPSPLRQARLPDERERSNNLGVWVTRAEQRPHTTVMAFLSSVEDDIFLISHTGTFKSACIHRDPRCCFAIDHRSSFLFEKAVDWNFTLINAEATVIGRDTGLFSSIQAQFVAKNPWEEPFFTDPKVELFHLKPLGLICGGIERGR